MFTARLIARISPDSVLSPLRNPQFLKVWSATQVAYVCWMIQTVTVGWIMVETSSSEMVISLVQASTSMPSFFLAIFVGAIADSLGRWSVVIVGRTIIAVSSLGLAITYALGFGEPWLILMFCFLVGCGVAINDPAWHSSVGDIVGTKELPAAIALLAIGLNVFRSLGPALGGLLLATFGPQVALSLSAAGYFVPVLAVWRFRWKSSRPNLPPERLLPAITDGARFTSMSPTIKAAGLRGMLFGICGISVLSLLPVVARDMPNPSAVQYGALMAGFGLGAVVAGLGMARIRRRLSQETMVRLSCVAVAVCALCMANLSSPILVFLALMLGGFGWVIASSTIAVTIQLASPRWIVARTVSIYMATTYGGMAAGSWLWGYTAETQSVTLALTISGGATMVVALIGYLLPIRETGELETTDGGAVELPQVALPIRPSSGPIVSARDYIVPEKDLSAFLVLMQRRRLALRRIGAKVWTLKRDLQDPRLWTESYRTATWTEFHRLMHRMSAADRELERTLTDLVQSPGPQPRLSIERATKEYTKAPPVPSIISRI